jgi:membrane-associated phospholipid phosphatase/predicted MFS family arabinose efflux permease
MSAVALPARAAPRVGRRPSLYLIVFAAAAVGAGAGRAVTTTYLPVLLNEIRDAPGLIGLVMLVNAGTGLSVPLVVGFWSDRRRARGAGGRLPFVFGGTVLAAGGLVSIALGSSSSYLALAAFATIAYAGLNVLTTAHRALVPELFAAGERPRATSAQELALLAGGLLGLAAGGALTELALWAPFVAAAALLPLLALPTLLRVEEKEATEHAPEERRPPLAYYAQAATRPGVRTLLLAEVLWVMGYAALPAFFVLYAEHVLDLTPARASLVLAGFGLVTAAAVFGAGRVKRPELLRPMLLAGVALMGGGLIAVPLTTNLFVVAPALVAGAAGFGIVSTAGFPYLATMIPAGEAGAYTALFFSVRSIGSTLALPLAGGLIAYTESYRTLFFLSGGVTLAALLPLARCHVHTCGRRPSALWTLRWVGSLGVLYAAVLVSGLLVAGTDLQRVDATLFRWLNALGPGPELLFEVLEEPGRNYLLLGALTLLAAALVRPRRLRNVVALELVSVAVALGLLQALYAAFDRPRPSEVFDRAEIALAGGHNWAAIESFPSGHMAVVTALAASAWFAIPALRGPLVLYIALNAVTRVAFGAHFPVDVAAGAALGYGSALAGRSLVAQAAALRDVPARASPRIARAPLSPDRVWAVMPSHDDIPAPALLRAVLRQVRGLVIVDDGSSPAAARELERIATDPAIRLVRLDGRQGKGAALRTGISTALERIPTPEAVLLIDADGQHPPESIEALYEAGSWAELVIGDRFDDLASMPVHRRVANLVSRRVLELATGRHVRDTQSGMRLLRGRALALPLEGDGYEAESRHLKAALIHDVEVAWVPIRAIYGDERSLFRPVRDSALVLAALMRPVERRALLPSPLLRPAGFQRARPSRSALRGRPATVQPAPQAREAAL